MCSNRVERLKMFENVQKRICRRMAPYCMTPMKAVPVIGNTASQRGIKRKLESNTPMKENVDFNLTPVDLRQRIKHRRKDPHKMPENIDLNIYFDHYTTITEAIKYRCVKIVLAWCPNSVVTGDFLSTLVHKYGDVINLRDRWLPSASCDGKMEWGGMTVFYKEERDAIEAAKDLPLQSKYVKAISMLKIVNDIANIEAAHPMYGRDATKLIIHTEHRSAKKYKFQLEDLLRQCGEVLHVKCKRNVCIVHFRYFTHAHLASVILNEDEQKHFGKISAVVDKSEKKDYILDLLKENVMLHVEHCYSCR